MNKLKVPNTYPIDKTAGPGFLGYIARLKEPYYWFFWSGRSQRAELWSIAGLIALAMIAANTISSTIWLLFDTSDSIHFLPYLAVMPLAIPFWSTVIRRGNDAGINVFIALMFSQLMFIIPSQRFKNAHGHHPKSYLLSKERNVGGASASIEETS